MNTANKKIVLKFAEKEKLYHYTTFESACKIIASKKLKYGLLKGMNDINEAYHIGFWDEELSKCGINQCALDEEIGKYKQLSFSIDKDGVMGFDIPVMWGHYADKGYGVCLVFDKEKIAELTKDDVYYHQNAVDYDLDCPDIIIHNPDIDTLLWQNKNEFFFKKTKDWEHEQEYRIITRRDDDYLSFGKATLMAVIMCYSKSQNDKSKPIGDSTEVKIMESILHDQNISLVYYSYHNFINGEQSALTHVHGDYTLWPAKHISVEGNEIIVNSIYDQIKRQ